MLIAKHVSIDRAAKLLQSDRKAIWRGVEALGITLRPVGKFRYLRTSDMDRIGDWLAGRTKVIAARKRIPDPEPVEPDEPATPIQELAARIEAARRFKRRHFGMYDVTDKDIDAELAAIRQGVAI